MDNITLTQQILIGLVFVWSGFVRSGLGFGGSVLALPFLLLIIDNPIVFLPAVSIHLIIFSSWIMLESYWKARKSGSASEGVDTTPDWPFLKRALKIMIIPKLVGVIGLIALPAQIMSGVIFTITTAYAVGYIINRPIRHKSPWLDRALLAGGGYLSGASLAGAPLIIPVFASHVEKSRLRNSLFVLWLILVLVKLSSFLIVGVDLQLAAQVWLLPCALVGHLMGNQLHARILKAENKTFFRYLGSGLLVVGLAGLWQTLA